MCIYLILHSGIQCGPSILVPRLVLSSGKMTQHVNKIDTTPPLVGLIPQKSDRS